MPLSSSVLLETHNPYSIAKYFSVASSLMPSMKKPSSGQRVGRRQKVSSVEESRYQLDTRVTVSALPEDVLLEIFNFYLETSYGKFYDEWHTLVHVCKNWGRIVFASPRRLQLQLLCTSKRPVHNTLDLWPELPIVVREYIDIQGSKPRGLRNIIAALKQHSRVCEISIVNIPNPWLERIRAMKMMDPFPALTYLSLLSSNDNVPSLPDSFLGGSAPRLLEIHLSGIPFPGLPKLLLSTRDLVVLSLWGIPLSGYISPEAMVTGLSALTRLQTFRLTFRSPRSRAAGENRLLPRPTRFVLLALTEFELKGDSEYVEDILAQIDTPQLDMLQITFFNQLIFDTPLLRNFISRTETLKLPYQAKMTFGWDSVSFGLAANGELRTPYLSSSILCRPSDWQLSSLAQICHPALFPLSTVNHLEIISYRTSWEGDMDITQWLEALNPFTSVMDLVLKGSLARLVALVLEHLTGERVTEVLPALKNIFLLGPQPEFVNKAIEKFTTARRLIGRPVIVHHRGTGG